LVTLLLLLIRYLFGWKIAKILIFPSNLSLQYLKNPPEENIIKGSEERFGWEYNITKNITFVNKYFNLLNKLLKIF